MPRRAFMYGPGDVLPPVYPWLPVQIVKTVSIVDDNVIQLVTSEVTYRVPGGHVMHMPMRPDASTRVWGTETPRLDQLCIGDMLDVKNRRWVVTDMYHVVGAAITTMAVELLHHETGEVMNCLGYAGQAFVPMAIDFRRSKRGESRLTREAHPERGPYFDKLNPDITYMFLVHPTGRGRWPADVPTFAFKDVPNPTGYPYETRPPAAQGKGSFKTWSRLEFAGDTNSRRHPSDPKYQP